MFLKKVCLFLAVAFLIVDIFLFSIYFQARSNLRMLSGEMIENTVLYYESNGVKIDRDAIKSDIPENAIYTFDSENIDVSSNITAQLAKKMFSDSATVGFVETPDGVSYSISMNSKVVASFRTYGESFQFEYSQTPFSKDSVPFLLSEAFENDSKDVTSEQNKKIDSFVKCLSLRTEPEYKVLGVSKTGMGTYVSIQQIVYEDYPVKDMYMNLLLDGTDIVYADGNWIFSGIKKSYKEQLTDGVNVLRRLDISMVSSINSENIVYMYRNSGKGRYYLIPAWKIEYIDTDGNAGTQYIDAIKS